MGAAISVQNISKRYRIRTADRGVPYRTLREDLMRLASASTRWMRGGDTGFEDFWALRDVSFEVPAGEVVGVIGRNGAGKSTLLKILSRITRPTTGYARLRGRVASLLEVGTGFHPELTGRENVFLSGAILGMKRHEIRRRFDEIVAFSEVEQFLDTPVKRYSSGMYVRLGFAVAAHLETEILLIDEVLAVGDVPFQKKCLGRMGEVANSGRTVFFVSHNMEAVRNLCREVIWLERARLYAQGSAHQVVSDYLRTCDNNSQARTFDDAWKSADGTVRVTSLRVEASGNPSDSITVETPIDLIIEFHNSQANRLLNVSLLVYDEHGACAFNTFSQPRATPSGDVRCVCKIPGNLLNASAYQIEVSLVEDAARQIIKIPGAIQLTVQDGARDTWFGPWVGAVRPQLRWSQEMLSESPSATS